MCLIRLLFICMVVPIIGVALQFLTPMQTLALLAGLVVLFALMGQIIGPLIIRLLKHLGTDTTGRAMRGAQVKLHAVRPVPVPDNYDPGASSDPAASARGLPTHPLGPRHFYEITATLTPSSSGNGKKQAAWNPALLEVVSFEATVMPASEPRPAGDTSVVSSLKLSNGSRFEPFNGKPVTGEQKARLVVGVKPTTSRVKFQYVLESFGDIELPAPYQEQAGGTPTNPAGVRLITRSTHP